MPKRTHLTRILLVLPGIGLAGCNVSSQMNSSPRMEYSKIEQREMSPSSRAAIQASSANASDALSRMDAYRAALQKSGK
jgi:hypothetical protein